VRSACLDHDRAVGDRVAMADRGKRVQLRREARVGARQSLAEQGKLVLESGSRLALVQLRSPVEILRETRDGFAESIDGRREPPQLAQAAAVLSAHGAAS